MGVGLMFSPLLLSLPKVVRSAVPKDMRVDQLALPFSGCNIQDNRSYILPGQRSESGPDGVDVVKWPQRHEKEQYC